MNDLTTTTKHPVTHNADGTITATVSIKLTREQWEAFERKFNTRHLACAIGLAGYFREVENRKNT